jgi:hypothetical protein
MKPLPLTALGAALLAASWWHGWHSKGDQLASQANTQQLQQARQALADYVTQIPPRPPSPTGYNNTPPNWPAPAPASNRTTAAMPKPHHYLMIATSMLAACNSFKPPSPPSNHTTASSLTRQLPTIDPPDSPSWDDLAQRYLQLAALYGKCVVERAGLIRAADAQQSVRFLFPSKMR